MYPIGTPPRTEDGARPRVDRAFAVGRWARVGLALAFAVVQSGFGTPVKAQEPPDGEALLAAARTTQRAARAKLQVLGDAFVCPDARFVSYRRSDFEPQYVDHWYVASQLWADVALQAAIAPAADAEPGSVAALDSATEPMTDNADEPSARLRQLVAPADWDAGDARCYTEKAHIFLDRQWDYAGGGGYFPRSNATGTSVEAEVRFGDDNALTALVLVDLAQITLDPLRRQQYLHGARQQAEFLIHSGLWDNELGGGFWWNTTHGTSAEGKPAQTNALAALFFGRLYQATGDELYRTWMLRTLLWLDTILYDPAMHLYRWSISYRDIPAKTGAMVNARYVNYDQSIAIQAQLLAAKLDGDPSRLPRAVSVGEALQTAFWVPGHGYTLDAKGAQMYTSYGAWTSLGHLALYDATGDERWREWAQANLAALSGDLRDPDGGFGTQVFPCIGDLAQYCPPGMTGWITDHIRDGAAQAWVQQLQVALARRSPSGSAEEHAHGRPDRRDVAGG